MGFRAGQAALRVRSEQEQEVECDKDSEADVQRVSDLFCSLSHK